MWCLMEKHHCPKCGSGLEIEITRLSKNTIRLLMICPKCGYFREIIAREKKPTEPPSEIKTGLPIKPLESVPSDAPLGIKHIINLCRESSSATFIPVFYSDLHQDPPDFGCDVSVKSLVNLGFTYAFSEKISRLLEDRNISRLYKFQEEAIRLILKGEDVVIVAQTAMGKTEAFLLPALQIATHADTYPAVLAIYPTKALARDQLLKFMYYAKPLGLTVRVIDGDTPWRERRKIIENPPHLLITNFDMIHYWLPRYRSRHGSIVRLFTSARLLIIDEVHVYNGAFGTNIHYILKRLSRLIEEKGRKLQLVLSSATIANPKEFAECLTERKIKTIIGKGRRSKLSVLFIYSYDPPFKTSARLLAELVKSHIKTLAFFNTRSSAELAYNVIRRSRDPHIVGKIELHRAGIPARTRVLIEQKFKRNLILGMLSTPTLELGIDIGNVSTVITTLTPVDRFIQRSGRAGRREKPGSAILILRADDPISEYYAMNPEEYFRDVSGRYLEPRNRFIAQRHVYLMAYEKSLKKHEIEKYSIPTEIIEELEKERALFRTLDGWVANGTVFHKYFSRNIRGIDIQIEVYYGNKKIDEREIIIALKELYPGAIYLNRGTKYIVKKLDLNKRIAILEKAPQDYQYFYTRPLYSHSAAPIGELESKNICGTIIFHGPLRMTMTVWGYAVFREGEKKTIIQRKLSQPIQYQYPTYGLFFRAPAYFSQTEEEIAGAYHATEHILIDGTYRISGGSEYDLGGISYGTSGIIVIHDALPGGNGVSLLLFERFRDAVIKSHEILTSNPCMNKEPLNKCVFSYHCGNNNQPLNQKGAREILEKMMKEEKAPNPEKAPQLLELFEKGIV